MTQCGEVSCRLDAVMEMRLILVSHITKKKYSALVYACQEHFDEENKIKHNVQSYRRL